QAGGHGGSRAGGYDKFLARASDVHGDTGSEEVGEVLGDVHRHADAAVRGGALRHAQRAVEGDAAVEVDRVVEAPEGRGLPAGEAASRPEVARARRGVAAPGDGGPAVLRAVVLPRAGRDVRDEPGPAVLVEDEVLALKVDVHAVLLALLVHRTRFLGVGEGLPE